MQASFIFVFLFILILNLVPQQTTAFDLAKQRQDHKMLAQIFLQNNDYDLAKKEDPGLITDLDKTVEEIKRWEKIINKYPNYRDGYIQLAILNWRVFRETESRSFLSRARELDPNHPLPVLP